MALSKRDTKIAYIMVTVVLGYLVWSMGVEPVLQSYTDLSEQLEVERNKYVTNQTTLAEARKIEDEYRRVEAQFPKDDPERDPSEVFNEEVVNLVRETVGTQPDYKPPETAEIKGATGYEFLILPLSVKGPLDKISGLFKEFEKRGYLVQRATITRDNDLSKEDLTVDLNLGRIVKIQEEEEGPARPGSLKLNKGGK